MSTYQSMTSQRVDAIFKRFVQISATLTEVHPDSPIAAELKQEVGVLQAEMEKLVPLALAEGPWWGRPFIWCCRMLGHLTAPLVRAGVLLYHMARGLL